MWFPGTSERKTTVDTEAVAMGSSVAPRLSP